MTLSVPRRRSAAPTLLLGIIMVACGRKQGIEQFGSTREAFLGSLAPLIAFPLVGTALLAAHGAGRLAAAQFLATLCVLLVPPVLSFELARLWNRRNAWLRFATAFNWCQWAIPVVAMLVLTLAGPLMMGGDRASLAVLLSVIGIYALWLHWFIARHGLGISGLRAALLVLLVNAATGLLAIGPALLTSP